MLFDMTPMLLQAFARYPVVKTPEPVAAPANDYTPLDPKALIDHILERYHATHLREFPEAIRLARKVEAVHWAAPECPRGLADHLALMADDLEGHQGKEERVLFPMILAGETRISFPVRRMMAEHLDVEEQLQRLRALTHDYTAPMGACASWRELCRACRKLDADLVQHMRLENDVLFAPYLD